MSEQNGQPQPIQLTQEQLLAQLINGNQMLQGQVQFLENRIRELTPKLPEPSRPTTEMPENPQIGVTLPADVARANGEGQIEQNALPASASPITPPAPGKLRIMIGVPLLAVSYEFFESFLKFWTALIGHKREKYEVCYHFAYRRPVHMAEEYLVKTAMFNKCTHILLMDDDIFDVTPDDLDRLVDANVEMISGVMHASKFPHAMCVFRRYDTSKRVIDMPGDTSMYRLYEIQPSCPHCKFQQPAWDVHFCYGCGKEIDIEVQECDLVPFPFTLIDLKVFDKIKKPWFHCTNEYPTDSWFCDRLLEAGLKPHAHMMVRLNHTGVTDETKPHFCNMGMARMQKNKAIVHLSPDQMDIHQNLLYHRMKEVEDSIKPKLPVISGAEKVSGEEKPDLTLVTAVAR